MEKESWAIIDDLDTSEEQYFTFHGKYGPLQMGECEITETLGAPKVSSCTALDNFKNATWEKAKYNLKEVFYIIDYLSRRGEDCLILKNEFGFPKPNDNIVSSCILDSLHYKEGLTTTFEDGVEKPVVKLIFYFDHLTRADFLYLEKLGYGLMARYPQINHSPSIPFYFNPSNPLEMERTKGAIYSIHW